MESVPGSPVVEAVSQPDHDQGDLLGHLICPVEQEESPQLRPMQLKMLGCIACLSDGGQEPTTETTSAIMQCTGRENTTTRKNVTYFIDQGLLIEEPRTVSRSGRGGSRFQHRLTEKGLQSLPLDWRRCDDVDMMVGPFASLPKNQQQLLRCVACLTGQGKEALNTDIAYCNDMKPNNTRNPLRKLADLGLLATSLVEPEQGKGAKQRLAYTPTEKLVSHMPTIPSPEECALNSKIASRQAESLTAEQQRTLRCIACIADRGTFEYGAAKPAVEACSGLDQPTTSRNGHKLASLELATIHSKGFLKDKPAATRTFYTLNEQGKAVADTLPDNWECTNPENTEAINATDAIKRCITCIWARQLGANSEPAAIVSMIRQCTGLSNMTARKTLARLAKQGEIEQTTISHALRNQNQTMMAFTPLRRSIELQMQETCNLGLYPDVPAEYLEPAVFTPLRMRLKRSMARQEDSGFIASRKHHALLTKEQELALGAIIQGESSDEEREQAVAMFIEHNVKLALWYVSHKTAFEGLFLSFDDRVQEALFGIEAAARRFDPTLDLRFSSYATFWMKQRVQRAAAAYADIPKNIFPRIPTSYYKAKDFEAQYGRKPTILELALACKLTPRQVIGVMNARESFNKHALSLDHMVEDQSGRGRMFGGGRTLHDIVGANENNFGNIEISEALQKLIPHLADHEKVVLSNMLRTTGVLRRKQIAQMFATQSYAIQLAESRVNALLRHPYFGTTVTRNEWQLDAACATTNNDIVIESPRAMREVSPEVAKLCGFCPVRKECFMETLKGDKPVTAGIWAGYTPVQLREYYKISRSKRVTAKQAPETSAAHS